jgi:hypothetical protein
MIYIVWYCILIVIYLLTMLFDSAWMGPWSVALFVGALISVEYYLLHEVRSKIDTRAMVSHYLSLLGTFDEQTRVMLADLIEGMGGEVDRGGD